MAYIGRSVDIGMFEKQVLTPNSSTTTFTLTFSVGSSNSLLVVYGGVIQEPGVAYSVSGGGQQIVFSEAPVTNTTLYIIYLGKQLTTPRAAGQETTKQSLTGDGVTTLFTLTDPPVVPAGIMVFVDGILQREGAGNNYVSGGSTINFNGAPDSGAEIDVYTLVKEKVSIDTVVDGSITRAKMAATFPYWDASGNFGINAATPSFKLVVNNNTSTPTASGFSGNDVTLQLVGKDGQNHRIVSQSYGGVNNFLNVSAYGGTLASPSATVSGTTIFGISAAGYGATTAVNGLARISILSESTFTDTSAPTYISLQTTPVNGVTAAERVRIDSAGRLGINTSTAKALLHVASSNASDTPTLGTATGGVFVTNSNTNYGLHIGSQSTGNAWLQVTRNDATATAYDLILQPAGGNLGIGTISPIASNTSGVAFVPGTTTVASMTGSNGSGQLFLGNNGGGSNVVNNDTCGMIAFKARFNGTFGGGNDIASIIGTYTGDGTSRTGVIRFLTLNNGAEAERMRVTSTGQLLIGKTTGNTYLNVQTAFDYQTTTFTSGAGNFGYIALPQTPSTTMMLVDLTNANNGNLNMSFILLVNTRNLAFGGGNGVTVVSSTQGSTGTGGEIGSYAFAITGTTTNLSLRATATLVSGSATIQFSARIIQI